MDGVIKNETVSQVINCCGSSADRATTESEGKMRLKDKKMDRYIDHKTNANNGRSAIVIGPDGFSRPLTKENWLIMENEAAEIFKTIMNERAQKKVS